MTAYSTKCALCLSQERLQISELAQQQRRRLGDSGVEASTSTQQQQQGRSGRMSAMLATFDDVTSATDKEEGGDPFLPTDTSAAPERGAVAALPDMPWLLGPRLRQGEGGDHPIYNCAVWQLPARPLFFVADRTSAKAFAKRVADAVQVRALELMPGV